MSVYDRERLAPTAAPAGFADDIDDVHFVPAPCQVACPIGTDAPSYIGYIWEGKVEEAFEAIVATNPFSSICGRVCDAPCEPACRRADSDGPIAIRNLKRFIMDKLGSSHRLPVRNVTRKETIGIVGSGPAGLTAAQDLAEAGFEVHVYEMTDRLGGMMIWGIPAFRLPPNIIKEDIDRMLDHCPGIKVHLNTALGRDVSLEQLKSRHDAVLLTIGAWWGKNMDIPGHQDARVIDGVKFLRQVNDGERPPMPETVIVVGGGDVAMDACRAAIRLPGCKQVKVLYRRGPAEMPARKDELEGAIKENIEIIYNTQPVQVVATNERFALRCVTTALGEPGPDGRRRPINVAGSETDVECGLVIMAVGQKTEQDDLAKIGLMAEDRVRTSWPTMRTADPKVFAAGDGAFGGSTIVKAMFHGHRVAYYIKALLDGVPDPLPYRTPYKTRRVPVAQDPKWEIFPRQHQDFHGLGKEPIKFPEIESTYDEQAAKDEAARCYRCDAETGSADYSVKNREEIFVLARTKPTDGITGPTALNNRLQLKPDPFGPEHQPNLEDIVFLPANLSRLVIDPYRDACNIGSRLAGKLDLALPILATGFDDAGTELRQAVAAAVKTHGSAYLGRRSVGPDATWLQILGAAGEKPSADAAGFALAATHAMASGMPDKAASGQLAGIIATRAELAKALPWALERALDFIVLDGTVGIDGKWPELKGRPDYAVLRDAIRIVRKMNREEDIALVYFGGVRSGTDTAKLVALGANAVVVGTAMGLALAGEIVGDELGFYSDTPAEQRRDMAESFLRALSAEATIMARCTGKTNVFNLEPEDLRSITLTTARAVGVPLVGTREVAAAE